jgi:hypothetical protein
MGMACNICNHSRRLEIDRELVSGKSKASIARQFGVSEGSLLNHETSHLSRQLVQAFGKESALQSMDLLTRIESILSRAEMIFQRNYDKNRDVTALKALSEQRSTIELLSKIAYALHQARIAELELEREKSGEAAEEAWQIQQERLKVLTTAEVDMWTRIGFKIQEQDASTIIIPDEPERDWPESPLIPTPAPIPEPAKEESSLVEMVRGKGRKNQIGVHPIEPIEIPSGGSARMSRWNLGRKIYQGLEER